MVPGGPLGTPGEQLPAQPSNNGGVMMMKSLIRMLGTIAAGWAMGAGAGPAEMTVCVVDGAIQNNINYAGLATTKTNLLCELDKPNYRPTLPELYAEGWRLIQVVGGENSVARLGQNVKLPLYYLERAHTASDSGQARQEEAPRSQPGSAEKSKGFSLF
jgi:hypothetical protein